MTSQNKLKRNLVRLHLGYLASSFAAKADASTQEEIFHQILFPFLLFSKSRQKTTELVWDTIDSNLLPLSGGVIAEWLSGCPVLVNAGKVTEDVDDVDSMNQVNYNIAKQIARQCFLFCYLSSAVHSYWLSFRKHHQLRPFYY